MGFWKALGGVLLVLFLIGSGLWVFVLVWLLFFHRDASRPTISTGAGTPSGQATDDGCDLLAVAAGVYVAHEIFERHDGGHHR